MICPRCNIGKDTDGDGNCSVCAEWDQLLVTVARGRLASCKLKIIDEINVIKRSGL